METRSSNHRASLAALFGLLAAAAARVRQGLDYPQIELATKIRAKYIGALEDEQFGILPAQPYVKGFLRTYAEFLGLDGQLYVDEYSSRFVADGSEEATPRRVSPRV